MPASTQRIALLAAILGASAAQASVYKPVDVPMLKPLRDGTVLIFERTQKGTKDLMRIEVLTCDDKGCDTRVSTDDRLQDLAILPTEALRIPKDHMYRKAAFLRKITPTRQRTTIPQTSLMVDRYEVMSHGGRWRETWDLSVAGREVVRYRREIDGEERLLLERHSMALDFSGVEIR